MLDTILRDKYIVKKVVKRILKILLVVLTLFFLTLTGFYIWLNQRLDKVVNKETYQSLVEEIRTSQELPPQFYNIYGQVTGYKDNSTTNRFLFYNILRILMNKNGRPYCPCIDVNYGMVYKTLDTWTVGLALDRDVSPRKCLDFYLNNYDFSFPVKGVSDASNFYYKKRIEQLTDDEILELSVMTLNPSYYNKNRNPENLNKKVLEIKEKK